MDVVAKYLLLPKLWPYRRTFHRLLLRDFRARYAGTTLGVAWNLLRPLLILGLYYFAFGIVLGDKMGYGEDIPYVLYLLSGIIPWFCFIEGASKGSNALVSGAGLIQRVRLPVELLTFKTVLQPAIVYFFLVLLLWLFVSGTRAPLQVFYLFLWIALQLLFTFYLVHAVAIVTLVYRDFGEIFNVVAGRLIFLSPVLFPVARVPEEFRALMYLNPMTPFVNGYHRLILDGAMPALSDQVLVFAWLVVIGFFAVLLQQRAGNDLVDWS